MRSEGNVYNPVPERAAKVQAGEEAARIDTRVIEIACDARLHRSIMLPANPGMGRITPVRVTYSDIGRPAEVSDGFKKPVLLWAGGMFGGRYQTLMWDEKAKNSGIRIIAVDRPGIGGTGSVPLEHRISTWLEIVPVLLKHLDIEYVSLAAHSAGSIFILSTAVHLRHLLHPERPLITFFGPWIPPENSGKWSMGVVRILPGSLIEGWAGMVKFMHSYIAPAIDAFQISYTKSRRHPAASSFKNKTDAQCAADDEIKTEEEKSWALASALQNLITNYIFKESIQGANDEALLCFGKGKTNWPGVAAAIKEISTAEKDLNASKDSLPSRKFRIQVFYAEEDEMIGKGGTEYMHSCLDRAAKDHAISIEEFVVKGTDHNSLLDPYYEAPFVMLECLSRPDRIKDLEAQPDLFRFCRRRTS